MNYPFEFMELPITDRVLDKLGFAEYWDGCGDFGERSFGVRLPEDPHNRFHPDYSVYRLVEIDEKDDYCDGFCEDLQYLARYWYSPFKHISFRKIYFLHDLYEDILANNPDLIPFFEEAAKKVNMHPFLDSYKKFKNDE